MAEFRYKIADQQHEFEAIHRLNYRTFVEEIPQHPPNAARRLVDRFHDENVYAICTSGDELVGMVAGRCVRPFSLDAKLGNLDHYLPSHVKAVEIRLLAVEPMHRHQPVFARLVVQLARHFRSRGCDLAVISGTVRQLELYGHLGFQQFGPLVGSPDAQYQPMYLTLENWFRTKSLADAAEPRAMARFLPGPVVVSEAVRRAFTADPVSHRSPEFMARMARARRNLCALTGAPHACLLVGTGTLANDAIAAQIRHRGGAGLVLANGEFGERLAAHARGWGLSHEVVQMPWGQCFDWGEVGRHASRTRPSWIWAVLSETSTGMHNSADRLRDICHRAGAALCLDAVSAVGLMPVDLRGVWLASAVSGKGLAAYTGLSIVFHDGHPAPAGMLPRYLDLAACEDSAGVPFSQSSNLVAALDCALASTSWAARFRRIRAIDRSLRAELMDRGIPPLVDEACGTPGILTMELPSGTESVRVAQALKRDGIYLAHESDYLQRRNWLQICLMGECDTAIAQEIPERLDAQLRCRAPRSGRLDYRRSLRG